MNTHLGIQYLFFNILYRAQSLVWASAQQNAEILLRKSERDCEVARTNKCKSWIFLVNCEIEDFVMVLGLCTYLYFPHFHIGIDDQRGRR